MPTSWPRRRPCRPDKDDAPAPKHAFRLMPRRPARWRIGHARVQSLASRQRQRFRQRLTNQLVSESVARFARGRYGDDQMCPLGFFERVERRLGCSVSSASTSDRLNVRPTTAAVVSSRRAASLNRCRRRPITSRTPSGTWSVSSTKIGTATRPRRRTACRLPKDAETLPRRRTGCLPSPGR